MLYTKVRACGKVETGTDTDVSCSLTVHVEGLTREHPGNQASLSPLPPRPLLLLPGSSFDSCKIGTFFSASSLSSASLLSCVETSLKEFSSIGNVSEPSLCDSLSISKLLSWTSSSESSSLAIKPKRIAAAGNVNLSDVTRGDFKMFEMSY